LRAAWLLVFAMTASGCGLFSHGQPAATGARQPAAPRVTAGELDARVLLGDVPARASRLGAGAPAIVASSEAVENEWVGGFVDVPRSDCLLAYARGSASIEDVDVAIYSDEGTELAVDEGRDVHPTVILCAPHPDRVYVAGHVAEGEGLVVVGAQIVPKEMAAVVGRSLGARGGLADGPRPAEAWPGLEETVRTHRGALGGKWEDVKRVAMSVDARTPTFVGLPIEADQCVDALVLPDDDVALLDVEALDEHGRVMARAREGSGARTLTICSPVTVDGSLSVRPHVGRGMAAVDVARARGDVVRDLSVRPDLAWVVTMQPLDAAERARNSLLSKNGYAAPLTTTKGALALGRRISVPLELKSQTDGCARVDVVAGAPLALVDARVWSDAGPLLASGEASSSLALFVCARGGARLDLETRGRPGPFAVTVRPEPWKDPAFAAHPLATSRMLARAAAGPDMLMDGRETPARALSLDASRLVSWTENLPAGRCVVAAIGAQGEGAGVELRAIDASDGGELDRSEAADGANVRVCAPSDAARTVRFEARASTGKLDAVLGERSAGK
jgi:hypothetical protein